MLCLGHRGAMGYAPENTLKSIAKALELGAPWVEVDVYYVDNHIVVIHDEKLERTTNGKGYLADKSFSYLRSLNAGDGEKIPTLEEVFDLIWGKARINIELKGPGTAKPVTGLIQDRVNNKWGMDNFLVSSLDHKSISEVKKLDGRIRIGLVLDGVSRYYPSITEELNTYSVTQNFNYVDSEFVMDAHNRGLRVFPYTVNEIEDIKRMEAMDVDGVFTDYPDRVLSLNQETDIK